MIYVYIHIMIYYIHLLRATQPEWKLTSATQIPAVLRIRSNWTKSFGARALQRSWSGSNSPAPQLKQLAMQRNLCGELGGLALI